MADRRSFLRSFALLAGGLAIAPARALADVQRLGDARAWIESDADRFERLARQRNAVNSVHRSGRLGLIPYDNVIQGETFVLDRPVRVPGRTRVHNCVFDIRVPRREEPWLVVDGDCVVVVHCTFDMRARRVNA